MVSKFNFYWLNYLGAGVFTETHSYDQNKDDKNL